ncbi:MAG TPA: hypothetical protein PK970_08110 [Hyphomicrobiaceae bacterium]|nr:hypothetical protein [Hyphomicrobiaceae bacterium]
MRQDVRHEIGDVPGDPGDGGGLFPPVVRRIMLGTVAVIALAGLYLIAVRGPVILFDLAGGIASLCF